MAILGCGSKGIEAVKLVTLLGFGTGSKGLISLYDGQTVGPAMLSTHFMLRLAAMT